METVLKAIADWIKGILTAGIMSNLSGLFDAVNEQVGDIAQQVGTRPSAFEPRVFAMIESLSRNVVLPIAGIILTFIACYELIEMITQHNNMAQFEPALIMRWIFKTAVSVWFISNTFDIVMAVFDLTQKVVSDSSGIIAGNTRVNEIGLSMLEASLMQMDVGPLFGLFLQSFFIGITMRILSIVIFVIVYGRIIEIYCMVSLAPIPMATWGNHEQSHMGQNYLKCLFALGFQGFLILICVAIYAVLMLKEGFYHRPLTVIRPIDIENFLKGMRRDGRSDSYISKARGMLYQIFQKAEANDLVRRNPVRLAEKMRATGTAKRKEAFTTAEVAHLMKVLPDDRMGLSIRLLLGTGMRMQELLALEPQFIEEDGSVIHIRQAVKVVKGTVSIGSPKSKDSIRDIPVPLNVRSCAIKLRDTTDQFIWESPKTGLPCNPTHFRDVFRKSLEEAGDVRLLTPHSCRHTYVSQMQALGVDIQTIQSIVGHADTEMTEHYLHVQESIRQSAIQLFSEAFSA